MENKNFENEKIVTNDDYIGKKIVAVPKEQPNIGIDLDDTLIKDITSEVMNSTLDYSALESFLNVSQNRELVYQLIDTMAQDNTLSAVLETYAEDCVEMNDDGKVMWAESSDKDIAHYVNYLLDVMNVDKNSYAWVYSLIKYGDLYLRLYRESDYKDDPIFNVNNNRKKLDEDVKVKVYEKDDLYTHYIDKVQNPGEMFELVKYGKTMGYIKAPVRVESATELQKQAFNPSLYKYRYNKKDVTVYQADDFVHACLEDNSSRTQEQVSISTDDDNKDVTYDVKRGQSLLYNTFRSWRELSLLENSVLLNRITKSSIVRIIGIEVGDMGKEDVQRHLLDLKQMIEQKAAINTGNKMTEYTNPGPIENNIYVPTHNGKGSITPQQIGGDVDIKSLADLEYFRDKEFASLRVPKQYFGFTEDGAGFNGGTSLSIISSRYGKSIKRIQNTYIQAITDAVNLMLLNKGLTRYINKFKLKMVPPVTQEELDRREAASNKMRLVTDIMSEVSDIDNKANKLKILKSLLSTVLSDSEVIGLIQDEIDAIESENNPELTTKDNIEEKPEKEEIMRDFTNDLFTGDEEEEVETEEESEVENEEENEEDYLPSGTELGQDLTDNK